MAIRDMGAIEVRTLPGTEGATRRPGDLATGRPAWLSEDGLVFTHVVDGQLHRVCTSGGATWPAVLPGTDRVLSVAAAGRFDGAGQAVGPALSPDGTRIAFHRMAAGGGDVWMLDLADNVQRRFTFDRSLENATPVWSPDGTRIVVRSRCGDKWALVERPADGAGAETVLAEFPDVVSAMSWSPDGRHLLYMVVDPATNWDIWEVAGAVRDGAVPAVARRRA